MRRTTDPASDTVARGGVALAGAALLASAALSAKLAAAHMALIGGLCGAASLAEHCGWCAASVALAAAGLSSLGWAARPARRALPISA